MLKSNVSYVHLASEVQCTLCCHRQGFICGRRPLQKVVICDMSTLIMLGIMNSVDFAKEVS